MEQAQHFDSECTAKGKYVLEVAWFDEKRLCFVFHFIDDNVIEKKPHAMLYVILLSRKEKLVLFQIC